MLFNSYGFIFLFLPIVLLGFFQLARVHQACATAFLALASILFYGYWNPVYVGLLLGSIVCNYGFSLWIAGAGKPPENERKKPILVTAITTNIVLLSYFKYAGFFISSINGISGASFSNFEIVLPLGISFFTFTQIAFLVDTYKKEVHEHNFLRYLLFVTYFPHLIAGPLLHHKDMMPQFSRVSTFRVNWENVATGLILFTLGLWKKVYWADSFSPFATGVFDSVSRGISTGSLPTTYEAWSGALAYTMQIYFDFSGYTDMALGISLMFNIRLPINFNSPYKATSIIDFWRRWHITLSTFLRDYLYIPLGGSRTGRWRRYFNLMATMLLGGLWHGAGWTFIIWGALHGIYLAINHFWKAIVPARLILLVPLWLGAMTGGVLTFTAVVTAWVVFRSNDTARALTMLKAMFGIAAQPITFREVSQGKLLLQSGMSGRDLLGLLVPSLLWVWLLPNSICIRFIARNSWLTLLQIAGVLIVLYLAINRFGSYSPFLYFQF